MRRDTVRNVGIVLGLALAVFLASGNVVGGRIVSLIGIALRGLLLAAFIYVGYVLWRQSRHQLQYAPTRERSLVLIFAGALGVVLVAGFLWSSWDTATAAIFLVVVGALGYGLWWAWQEARRYY